MSLGRRPMSLREIEPPEAVLVDAVGVRAIRVRLGVDVVDRALLGIALVSHLVIHHLLIFSGVHAFDLRVEPLYTTFLDGGADIILREQA